MLGMLLAAPLQAADDYVYISDSLRVGVREEPVSGLPPIDVVLTGMRLKVHERVDGYIKITTAKGVTGWIKEIYVTDKAPAIIQLNEMKKKYQGLQQQLKEAKNTAELLEKANLALSEQLDELKSERHQWTKERAEILASQYKESSSFWWLAVVVLLLASFAAGVVYYKIRVMKRLGGLRV